MEQLLPILIYIQSNLEGDLSLSSVAETADLSAYHFHRLFRATVGETLKQHTQRLRLERAAYYLKIQDATILDIALKLGFSSHAAFTRAFKRWFGMTPKEFRDKHEHALTDMLRQQMSLNQYTDTFTLSWIAILRLAPLRVAFIRHLGSYIDVDVKLYDKLICWAQERGLYTGDNLIIGVGHDDPNITPVKKTRFDACLSVPEEATPDREVAIQTLPGGHFAAASYVGPYGPTMLEAYGQIFRQLAVREDVEVIGLPALEIYRTTRINPDYALNHTDIFLPVRTLHR